MKIEDTGNGFISEGEEMPSDKLPADQTADVDEQLLDYESLANTPGPEHDNSVKTTVGLVGGQPKDDETGLDISQYTGPNSKPSSQFKDPTAPSHTGPANNDE